MSDKQDADELEVQLFMLCSWRRQNGQVPRAQSSHRGLARLTLEPSGRGGGVLRRAARGISSRLSIVSGLLFDRKAQVLVRSVGYEQVTSLRWRKGKRDGSNQTCPEAWRVLCCGSSGLGICLPARHESGCGISCDRVWNRW